MQHHVQPVRDTQHSEERHHEQAVPTTEVYEKHVSSDQDKAALANLNRERDSREELAKDRVIVDKGEVVNENVKHHVS